MSPALVRVMLIVGIILIVAAAVSHYALRAQVFPHFNLVLGVVGVIVAAIGVLGMVMARGNAS